MRANAILGRARERRSLTDFLQRTLRAFRCIEIFLASLPGFFWLRLAGKADWRGRWAQWISHRFLSLINCDVDIAGAVPKGGLIVCNHLSYLDILVLLKACPAAFVAKREVRHWPFFGLLATMAGTVFVDRERRTAISGPISSIVRTLRSEIPVVIFPEGTSSDGAGVLPFRSALLEAALLADRAMTPAAIGYEMEDGSVADEICYWRDMVFCRHFWNLLGKRSIKASVRFGPPHQPGEGRKQHALALRSAVMRLRNDKSQA